MEMQKVKKEERGMKCAVCGGPIDMETSGWREGHNAWPVVEGRCCAVCNDTRVIPARLFRLFGKGKDQ